MTAPFLARREHFERVGSTNDVVRQWLAAGTPEVCLATADEQTAGRGREGRRWIAPPGASLLLSVGFRPTWSDAADVWRLAAVASVAMAEAAESVSGLPAGTIRLKWPNDLVVETSTGLKKLGGVLGETDGLGTDDPRVVLGLGVNADWAAAAFPDELAPTMTSLRVLAEGRAIDRHALADAFVGALEPRIDRLREPSDGGSFDGTAWAARQATTGHEIRVENANGSAMDVHATGVDTATGALIVEDRNQPGLARSVFVGEVVRVRLTDPTPVEV